MYFRTGNPKGLTESGSGELGIIVCGRVPWLYQYWPGGFILFVVLCPGTPGGSTGSGSGFKASQKTGHPEGSTESVFFFIIFFVAFPWVETSTGPGGFMICVFII